MNLDKIKKIDREKIVGRKADLQKAIQFSCNGAGGFGSFFKIKDLQHQLYYFDGRVTSIYFSKKEYFAFLNKAHKRLEDIEFVTRCETKILKVCKSCVNQGKALSDQIKYKSDGKELLKILEKFDDIWNNFYPIGWLFFFIEGFELRLEKKLIRNGFHYKEAREIINITSYIDRLTPTMESEIEILNLAGKIQQGKNNIKKYSEKLSNKFGWMTVYNTEDKERCPKYYLNEAEKIIKRGINIENKIKSVKQKIRDNNKTFSSYLSKLTDDLLKEQLKFLHISGYLRDKREEVRDMLTIFERPLYAAIAQKFDLSINEIVYLTNEEIKSLIINNNFKTKLKSLARKRSRQYAFLVEYGKMKIIDNQNKIVEIKKVCSFNKEIKEIKGKIACKHLKSAIGRAKIILNNKELDKIKKGDILVATMTKPDYLSAMKKASAIVTDEGGITCHAAIVAREINKPCIIGTKIATKVLKDGDLVEVDAERGIVKILEKNKI